MSETTNPTSQHKHTTRLINETSPYLLQHAHNPVDWYPWSEEALQKAQQEDKPILLSVGYSACHWCHVMERESFENEDIAGLMNQHFVSIKVDREERPDIDNIYMQAVQALTQQGGWPMTNLLTHLHRLRGEVGSKATRPELEIVEVSLQHMANGGIYDQLGGGFHRYSVDAEWLVPHFEKMLYDNALLSRLYLHTYLITGNPFYERIVEETLDYVAREMVSPQDGFYSTQDADSEGEEGKFFVWTPAEIEAALPAEDARLFMLYYGVTQAGNFEGKNILHVEQDAQTVAEEAQVSLETLQASLKRSREMLFELREKRVKPGRDEKILTSWNGLMLRSFAEAARYLDRSDYLQVATNNAEFLLRELNRDGRLLRTYKDGRSRLKGYLEDYAFLADGLLALYEASFNPHWFIEAHKLMDEAIALFADEQNGGFFDTGSDHEALISRPKDIMDNATPAGNSVAVDVLLRLAAFTGEEAYRRYADDYLRPIPDVVVQHPRAFV